MRTISAAALLLCALAIQHRPAAAQESCGPDKLGVARTATIDPATGPHFGAQFHGRKINPLLADGEVVLTFDDGPSHTNTRLVLDALAAHCTRATFFMVGRRALSDPETAKEVAARGHTVGAHTWSHARLADLADGEAETQIELGFSAVQQALDRPISPFFRFPYLRGSPFSLQHLDGRQIATFGIDIDSRDFEIRDAAALYERVMADAAAKRKGIILFHDIHASTAEALPRILDGLKARGFRVVHLVSKTGLKTVAEYDTLAQQELARRRLALARSPLAKRAVSWPLPEVRPVKAGEKATREAKDAKPAKEAASAADTAVAPPAPPKKDWAVDVWSSAQ
jgi:peptidoglycan/xylan/chitin deacetylase (PgdA/CDA1 family)